MFVVVYFVIDSVVDVQKIRSWETDSRTTGQEILCLFWYPNVQYRVQKSPSLDPILSQLNPTNTFTPYFFRVLSLRYCCENSPAETEENHESVNQKVLPDV